MKVSIGSSVQAQKMWKKTCGIGENGGLKDD